MIWGSHHTEVEFVDKLVQCPLIQDGVEISSLFWYEKIGEVEALAPIMTWDLLYGSFVEECACFLLEEVQLHWAGPVALARVAWGGKGVEFYKVSHVMTSSTLQ